MMRKVFGRKWIWTLVVLVVFAGWTAGCAAKPAAEVVQVEKQVLATRGVEAPREAAASRADSGGLGVGEALPNLTEMQRKIIYSVTLDLIVKDTQLALDDVRRVTKEMGGFVADSNVWRDEGHPRASLTVRVPAERLEEALTRFRELAVDVDRQTEDSQDVTEDYVDLEARLKNEQRAEAELQELLKTRSETGKTQDILEVYRELSTVRARIEQIQGKIKYLDNMSDLATVKISLTPDVLVQPVVVGKWKPQGTARNAVRSLLNALQFLANVTIYFFLLILPVLVVLAIPVVILILIIRALVRAAKRRRARRQQAVSSPVDQA